MRRPITLGATALLAVALAGCGGGGYGGGGGSTSSSSSSTSSTATGPVLQAVTIKEKEFSLTPSNILLSKPGTYVLKGMNVGSVDHALEVEGQGVEEESSAVGPGKTTTLKVNLPKSGTYEIYCPVDGHKDKGMEGMITVGSSAGGGGTTTGGSTSTTSSGYP